MPLPSMVVQIAHAARTSVLVRIAHAARTAAEATSRFARLAEERAAAGLSPEAEAPAGRRAGGGDHHRSAAAPPPDAVEEVDASFPPQCIKEFMERRRKNAVEFLVQEEDLKSDEALWALYERWRKAFNQKRDQTEMQSCFNDFKDTVLRKHRTKNSDLPVKLSRYADGKLRRARANYDGYEAMRAKKAGNSCVICKSDGSFLREVFAYFKVVNGKVFVFLPNGGEVELTTKYEVIDGKLFADLPEGNKLVIPNDDFTKGHRPFY